LDIARALELDGSYAEEAFQNPQDPVSNFDLSDVYKQLEDYLRRNPDDIPGLFLRGLNGTVRVFFGAPATELGPARAALDRVVALSPRHAFAYACRGYLRQAQGDLDGALEDVRRAEKLDGKRTFGPFLAAVVLAKKGERAAALDAIERAVGRGFRSLARLKGEPAFEPLRDDERWKAVVRRLTPG
ncbi:MAG TPA: hypothetical protein VHF22_06410, partial [Planctomycetota bacterium]|nr:hypothetical protein [Planctomycetota bacterium]